jgi:hypothetical protein
MKTKLLLTAALIGGAALSAQAGVRFGFSFGLPLPVPVVVTTPAYPAPGCGWAPGYWSVSGYSRVWVPGCWQHRPVHVAYGHARGWRRW